MEWMILPLKRYADFSGRSRRLEYWMFTLFFVLVLFGSVLISASVGILTDDSDSAGAGVAAVITVLAIVIAYLALLIPMLAVQVRRLHDQDKSGWFILIGFIPYVGGLIMLVLMCIDGTPGPNRFGPDPKGRGDTLSDVFA